MKIYNITGIGSSLTGSFSGSLVGSFEGSFSTTATANISGAFNDVSSSLASRISSNEGSVDSLNQASSSYLLNTTDTLVGDLTVTGTLTAQEFHTEFVSASILYDSGSTKFGNSADDTHTFRGQLFVSASDSENILTSKNYSATGAPDQFKIKHSSGSDVVQSLRGNLILSSSAGSVNLQPNGGNVGIGTATPDAKLDVLGNLKVRRAIASTQYTEIESGGGQSFVRAINGAAASYQALIFETGNNTTTTERMRINTSGYVGIGESTPLVPLHISRNTASGENIALILDNNDSTVNSEIAMLFRSYVGSTNTDYQIATVNTAGNQAQLVFRSDGGTERMRITHDGNVGIGEATPGAKLHIRDANGGIIRLDRNDTSGAAGEVLGKIDFWGNDFSGTGYDSRGFIQVAYEDVFARAYMSLGVGPYNQTSTEAIRITSTGNVGIGTTSPVSKLHVAGEILTTNPDPLIRLSPDSGTSAFIQKLSTANGDYLRIYDGTEYTATFKNGSIGIGTDAPYRTVHVNGANATLRVGPYYTSGGDRDFIDLIAHGSDSKIVSNNERFHIENNAGDIVLIASGGVGIGNTTPSAKLDINNANNSPSPIIMKLNGDGNSQGSAYNYKIVQHYPAVSSGNKLIIPFTSQGNLNGSTIVKIWGHSAMWNARLPKAFSAEFAVGHLTVLSDLTILSSTGNISSISIAGMNIEIDFASAYTSATANGLYLTLEYMTYIPAYSIIVENITMN